MSEPNEGRNQPGSSLGVHIYGTLEHHWEYSETGKVFTG